MLAIAEDVACRDGIRARRGTYVAVSGPNYETRAEYRMYRSLGADVIGMSTVPEVIVAAELGIPVLAISTVTNVCNPDAPAETDGASVAAAAARAEWKLRRIVLAALRSCRDRSSQHEAEDRAEQ
jgi:purine-nucleoside phosphorylase